MKLLEYLSILFSANADKTDKDNINQNDLYFKCPQCQHVITFEIPPIEDIILHCPVCGCMGIIHTSEKNQNQFLIHAAHHLLRYGRISDFEKKVFQPILPIKFIGIPFILLGVLFLFILTPFNLKLSVTLFIFGAVILGLMPGDKYLSIRRKNILKKAYFNDTQDTVNNSWDKSKVKSLLIQVDISEKITFAVIVFISILYILTGFDNIEIFLILIIIGILIIKELANEHIPDYLKKRINMIMLPLLVIFLIIVIRWWVSL